MASKCEGCPEVTFKIMDGKVYMTCKKHGKVMVMGKVPKAVWCKKGGA